MTDKSGSTSWMYDRLGRVIGKTQITNGISLTIVYNYAADGRLESIQYPSSKKIIYSYNAAGQIAGMALGTNSPFPLADDLITSVEYLPFGPVSKIEYAQTTDQYRLYDLDYDPTGFTNGLARSYNTNAAGEITTVTIGNERTSYSYDNLGRIADAENTLGQTVNSWLYDANGNLTENFGTTYSVDPENNQLTGGFQSTYSYDEMGNMTQFTQALTGSRAMSYGPNQRLIGFSNMGGAVTGDYLHNGRGERVLKTHFAFGIVGGTTLFVYNENGQLLGEYDDNGNVITEYHWLDNLLVGLNKGGVLYQVYTDHLGTPRAVRDQNDVTVWEWDNLTQPYGNSSPNEDYDGDGTSFTLNLRFPGQYYDLESGYFYNYYRDYDPRTGRYIESDPIGLGDGVNTYLYVHGSPLGSIDPTGQNALAVCGALAAADGPAPVGEVLCGCYALYRGVRLIASISDDAEQCQNTGPNNECEDNDENNGDKCQKAIRSARRIYLDLAVKRIPQFVFGARHGASDFGHFNAILQKQINLQDALNSIRRHCKTLPSEFEKWERLAYQDFPPRSL